MFFQGDFVKIKNKENYEGQLGKIIGYDGQKYYKIELSDIKKKNILCLEAQIEKISEESVKENEIVIKFEDGDKLKLNDQDLRLTCHLLKSNNFFKGLYALGKYYPYKSYPDKFKSDYFTQMIIKIKNGNRSAGEDISKIFFHFIEKSKNLNDIMNKIDYIVMMPTIQSFNHVKLWGDIISKDLKKKDISDVILISPEKRAQLEYYKYKRTHERTKIIEGAFKISKTKEGSPSLIEKRCLILDDICTTGNQINEMTNTLASEGVVEVYAIVIGRTKY